MDHRKFLEFPRTGHARQNAEYETVSRPDYKTILRQRAKDVENLIKGTDEKRHPSFADYRHAISGCMNQWTALCACQPEYKKQNLVLEAYYQRGKLRDYLEETVKYANTAPRSSDTAEKVAIKGYSNYLFVLKHTFENLQARYESYEVLPRQEDRTPIRTFLMQECRANPFYDNWFRLSEKIRQLLEKAKTQPLTDREFAQVFDELDLMEQTLNRQRDELTEYLREKQVSLQSRLEKMRQDCETGQALYQALQELLTPELFERMDPDTLEEEQKTMEQIKEEYRILAGRINETVLTQFPKV